MFETIKMCIAIAKERIRDMRADIDNDAVTPKKMVAHLFKPLIPKQSSIEPDNAKESAKDCGKDEQDSKVSKDSKE